jgi:hypothetical protein
VIGLGVDVILGRDQTGKQLPSSSLGLNFNACSLFSLA